MRFWLRELAGWGLVLLGLACFAVVLAFCYLHYIFEAWPFTIIGIFVFRGGIHLLKVAIAARICQQAQDRLYPAPAVRPLATALRRAGTAPRPGT